MSAGFLVTSLSVVVCFVHLMFQNNWLEFLPTLQVTWLMHLHPEMSSQGLFLHDGKVKHVKIS